MWCLWGLFRVYRLNLFCFVVSLFFRSCVLCVGLDGWPGVGVKLGGDVEGFGEVGFGLCE